MSSADAVTAERADVGANGSDPTGLAGSNNMTTFLRRCVLSNRTLRWASGLSADDVTLVRLNIVQMKAKFFIFDGCHR